MDTLKIINNKTLFDLKKEVTEKDLTSVYKNDSTFRDLPDEYFLNTSIKVAEDAPELTPGAAQDADNALKVFSYLGTLSRTQAADPRLWATLTHTTFWEYTQKRWPNPTDSKYILEHWFEAGKGRAALRRNAISRLWWAAYLTLAPWEKDADLMAYKSSDRLKYTRILLSQQQVYQDIMERKYGGSLRLRICLLDSLAQGFEKVKNKDDLMKAMAIKLSVVLKHRQLDALEVCEISELVDSMVMDSIQ